VRVLGGMRAAAGGIKVCGLVVDGMSRSATCVHYEVFFFFFFAFVARTARWVDWCVVLVALFGRVVATPLLRAFFAACEGRDCRRRSALVRLLLRCELRDCLRQF
jgi:hypothetical protein